VKLVHLVGFITKKSVTMRGHMSRCAVTCHDARSHVTMHGHVTVKLRFLCKCDRTLKTTVNLNYI